MSDSLDDTLWAAIGDPTRRRLISLLVEAVGTPTSLGRQTPISRQAVAKQLGVLESVGLVHSTPAGRERRYELDEAQLARAVRQLRDVGDVWESRLNQIKRLAERLQRETNGGLT